MASLLDYITEVHYFYIIQVIRIFSTKIIMRNIIRNNIKITVYINS